MWKAGGAFTKAIWGYNTAILISWMFLIFLRWRAFVFFVIGAESSVLSHLFPRRSSVCYHCVHLRFETSRFRLLMELLCLILYSTRNSKMPETRDEWLFLQGQGKFFFLMFFFFFFFLIYSWTFIQGPLRYQLFWYIDYFWRFLQYRNTTSVFFFKITSLIQVWT